MITNRPARVISPAAALLLAVAAVAYSSWVLEAALPTGLSTVDGFASELFAADQPYRWFFGGLDIVAGACAALAGLLVLRLVRGRPPGLRWAYAGWAALVVFGVATILDVVFPLDCAPSLAPCDALEQAGRLSWRHDVHLVTSVIANAAGLAAIAALWWSARGGAARPVPSRRWGGGLFWGALVMTSATMLLSLHDMHYDVPSFLADGQGVPQRIQVGLLAVWLGLAAASLRRTGADGGDDGRGHGRGDGAARTGEPTDPARAGRTTWQAKDGRPVSSSRWTAWSCTSSGTDAATGRP
ncbi:DUF998 domain-containing protein [Yinghuangia sp. YIM S09857]|uniref:DUF998 domain-containing protein n=1 Tax=Yinghuangia sp. YIM S09857 TaxID=3436929 RepID=UPI003F53987F